MKCSSVGFLTVAASLLCLVSGDLATPSTRQLIRGGSSILHEQDDAEDLRILEEEDIDEERELGRVKARNNGSDSSSSSKGSKSGSSKGSKGSKGGSKGSKGDGGGGGRRRRSDGPICGAGCGDKDFAYIFLEGSYFFRGFNDDSVNVVPIEGTGSLNNTKNGSTLRILDQDLKGYAKYFDHGDAHPVQNDIHGSISGSCTILATYEGETTQVDSELCLAHCTMCVSYQGQCCQGSKPYDSEWGEPWGKESCETYGGYATITADLLFALEFRNGTGSSLISIPEGGLVSLEGLGPITGTALELSPASNGGVGYIEYDALDRRDGDVYKIGMKVPFNDRASCKLQDEFQGFDLPPPDTSTIPVPPPTRSPTVITPVLGSISGKVTSETLDGTPISGVVITLLDNGAVVSTTLTNQNGRYKFKDVPPGDYKLIEDDPTGFVSVSDFDTSTGDFDPDGASASDLVVDNMIAVTLLAGEDDKNNDFVDSLVTTSPPTPSPTPAPTPSPTPAPTPSPTPAPTPAPTPGQVIPTEGSISGKVTSGTLDGTPLVGVVITLLDSDGATVISTTSTNQNGRYKFEDVPPGDYKLMEADPTGFVSVSDFDTSTGDFDPDGASSSDLVVDNMIAVTLLAGEDDKNNDFVDSLVTTSPPTPSPTPAPTPSPTPSPTPAPTPAPTPGQVIPTEGSISGKVSTDTLEGNPIPGVVITLLASDGETVVATTSTNEQGQYIFMDIAPGDYKLMEANLAGYVSVSDFDRSTDVLNDPDGSSESDQLVDDMISVTLEAGENDEDNDFVDSLTQSISGKVSTDTLEGNPIPGVVITLLASDGETVVATTSTNEQGQYIFMDIAPGDYKLMEANLAGYVSVSDFDRSTDVLNDPDGSSESDQLVDDMISVTLEAGENDEDNDFVDSLPLPPCGTIKITEILYDPSIGAGGDKDGEWIEIYNNDCNATVNMEGWDVGNFNKRDKLTARRNGCNLELGPSKYGVIVDSNAYDDTTVPKTPMTVFIDDLESAEICVYESPFTFIGNRLVDNPGDDPSAVDLGSDRVVISDANGIAVDMVEFDSTNCGNPDQDVSLERITFTGPSNCSNFARSTDQSGSTPGEENSVFEEDECDCDLDPPGITPKDVIFSEINFAVPDIDQYLEVRNNDCCDIDLDNWSVGDTSLAGGLTPCPGSDTMLLIGKTALFVPFNANCSDYASLPDTKVFKIGNAENGDQIGSGLNADDETIFIYDSNGSIVDTVNYVCTGSARVNCGPTTPDANTTLQRKDALDPNSFEVLPPSPGQDTAGFQNAVVCTTTTIGPT